MSFVLPGNARQLRFTGEAKAFVPGDETPGGGVGIALGKPRVRKATTMPPPIAPATSSMTPVPHATSRPRNGHSAPPASMTPASPGTTNSRRLHTPVPSYGGHGGGPSIRQKSHSIDGIDEEMATMALDREGLDILPGGMSPTRRPPPSQGHAHHHSGQPVAAIPHFRPAQQQAGGAQVQMQANQLVPNDEGKAKGAPLALWLFAAVLAGVLSYHVTPAIMSHFEAPAPQAAKITPAI